MVTLLVYPPISNPQQGDSALTSEELERVASLTVDLVNLLAPMARIAARDTLEDLLHSTGPRFLAIKGEMMGLLWPLLSDASRASGLYEMMRILCGVKADMLGEDDTRTLVATIDSAQGLSEWSVALNREVGSHAYLLESIQQQTGEYILRADMCINALMIVLSDELKDWEPGSLGILVSAADEHMAAVEDALLASTGSSDATEETVSYESLRTELGI